MIMVNLILSEQTVISIFGGIVGSIITIVSSWFLFIIKRKELKEEFIFELYFKDLFPLVYKPILDEYYRYINNAHDQTLYQLNINLIESTIYKNYTLIKFSTSNNCELLLSLYSLCKSVNSNVDFPKKQEKILTKIKKLESNIEDDLKGYVDEQR